MKTRILLALAVALTACQSETERNDRLDDATVVVDATVFDAGFSDAQPDTTTSPPDDTRDASGGVFTRGDIDHACLHVQEGPFAQVSVAGTPADFVPEIRNTHTQYTLGLRAGENGHSATFKYRTTGPTWLYFFFSGANVPVKATASGLPLPVISEPLSGCQGILDGVLVEARSRAEVLVTIGPTPLPSLNFVFETRKFDVTEQDTLPPEPGDAGVSQPQDAGPMCRTSGPCTSNEECCDFCHNFDHCH